jgi:hypothetical protein
MQKTARLDMRLPSARMPGRANGDEQLKNQTVAEHPGGDKRELFAPPPCDTLEKV